MHQCDYCCWYNERYGNCDCPYVMKKLACDKAKKEKERRLKMIKKRYEVSCDLCGNGLNHYAELKPTCTDLRRDGFKVKINNGKVFVFCKECYEKIKKETKK